MMDAQPDSNSSKDRDSLGDESPMNPTPKAIVAGKRSRLTRAVLIGFLLLVVAVAALPGYLQLQWYLDVSPARHHPAPTARITPNRDRNPRLGNR
uniref:Uncharacterized protein n=1 Tax=Desertifilum tharense IPPAS B-1220 TaxID=1781255 RepID=A0ACD5GR03_9CYAN